MVYEHVRENDSPQPTAMQASLFYVNLNRGGEHAMRAFASPDNAPSRLALRVGLCYTHSVLAAASFLDHPQLPSQHHHCHHLE